MQLRGLMPAPMPDAKALSNATKALSKATKALMPAAKHGPVEGY